MIKIIFIGLLLIGCGKPITKKRRQLNLTALFFVDFPQKSFLIWICPLILIFCHLKALLTANKSYGPEIHGLSLEMLSILDGIRFLVNQ
jgi:hypothetical protein